jgi:hypothetical protein
MSFSAGWVIEKVGFIGRGECLVGDVVPHQYALASHGII